MKHTQHLTIQQIVSVAAAFVLTFSIGMSAGQAMVDDTDYNGANLSGYILRSQASSSAKSISSRKIVKRKVNARLKRLRQSAIRPTRRSQSGSSVASVARSTTSRAAIKASCGDKLLVRDLGEQCDDGNALNNDGCSSACLIEAGYTCAGVPSLCVARCADSIKTPTEKCDDGNLNGGDGCSGICKIEPGYVCSGSPSVCEPIPYCGDGVKAIAEGCDDGNNNNFDGCSATCTIE